MSLADGLLSVKGDVSTAAPSIYTSELSAVMSLAQSDCERQLIRYSVFKASGMSYTAAKKHYGFQNIKTTESHIVSAIEDAKGICKAVYDLAHTADMALLSSMGIEVTQDSDSDSDGCAEVHVDADSATELPGEVELCNIFENTKYNWFVVVQHIETNTTSSIVEHPHLMAYLGKMFNSILSRVSGQSRHLLEQSYNAAVASLEIQLQDNRIAAALNGDIVSESESDTAIVANLSAPEVKNLVAKKRRNLLQKFRRKKARLLAEQRYLSCSAGKNMKTIIDKHPNIGYEIESFVRSCDVGADRWRRIGVLTFDGNVRVKKKVTFRRIQEHLELLYGEKISYGTLVQLCIVRNKKYSSAKNYRGVAQVMSWRARKGFSIKYNPDTHWSGAFYRNLDIVQFKDGTNLTIINRDDAAGFRLDTVTTNSQHRTLVVDGNQTLTTHTDYVNRYPSILQTTSYNFMGTDTTGELCAGIVKAAKIYPKNPAQHYSDLQMLSTVEEFKLVFTNCVSQRPKSIECVRVDRGGDEGPSHLEVQFWSTRRHMQKKKTATLVTSRSSSASYLNRVELQNGCLALAHANLFIPSTLNGLILNPDTGDVDNDIYC